MYLGSLWLADRRHDTVYELDPANGSIRFQFAWPGTSCQGLAFDGEHL